MPSSNKAKEYVKKVCEQIRWKKAHAVVEQELLAHIEDQQEALMAEGRTAEEAEQLAVQEMGDPLDTGSKFDRLYRPRVEWNVVLFVGLLLVIGIVLRVTLLAALGEEFHLVQDLWGLPVGLALMILGYWLDYATILSGGMKTVFVGMVIIACFSFVLHGPMINGAYPLLIYVALFWPLVFCAFVTGLRGKGAVALLYSSVFIFLSAYFFRSTYVIIILLMFGTAGVILVYALWKKWFGCSRWWGCTFLCLPLLLFFFIVQQPYRIKRIYAMLDPFSDPLGAGYISCKVLTVLQQASWIGASPADLVVGALPDPTTDYLLTAALNQFGWLAVLAIFLVYTLLLTGCYLACHNVKNLQGKMVAVTITTVWLVQVLFYGLTNFIGLLSFNYPLLFVQGNFSMICNLFLLGIFLSVYKTGAVYQETSLPETKSCPKQMFP